MKLVDDVEDESVEKKEGQNQKTKRVDLGSEFIKVETVDKADERSKSTNASRKSGASDKHFLAHKSDSIKTKRIASASTTSRSFVFGCKRYHYNPVLDRFDTQDNRLLETATTDNAVHEML